MKRFQLFLRSYHPIVFSLLVGHMIARIATSMSLPFLAIYLANNTDMSTASIGIVAGAGALAGTFGGFIGGALSDRYSRRLIMFTALFAWSGVFMLFSITTEPALLLILSLLNGLCRSWFEPVAQVLMADLTEPERRYKVFSMRYLMANVGVSVGPLLGVWFGLGHGGLPFLITGCIYLVYAIVLYIMMIAFGIKDFEGQKKERITIGSAWNVVRRDRALVLFIGAAMLVGIGYSQLMVNLPAHLNQSFSQGVELFGRNMDGAQLFGYLLSFNAVVVIVLQMPLSRITERRSPLFSIYLGTVFLSVGLLGFGLATNVWMQALAMLLFTIGEILDYPAGNLLLDKLAPEHLRGAYFGAQTFGNLGQFIGPGVGGWLLGAYGGGTMFAVMAVVTVLSSLVYRAGSKKFTKAGETF